MIYKNSKLIEEFENEYLYENKEEKELKYGILKIK